MDCSEARPELVALVQEELEPLRAGEVRRHLQACPACLAEEREILATLDTARLVREEPPPLPGGLFDRIVERLDAPAAPPSVARPAPAPRDRFLGLAVAALLLCAAASVSLLFEVGGLGPAPPWAARLAYVGDAVFAVDAEGRPLTPSPGSRLPAGCEVRVRGAARFDLPGDVQVVLHDGAARLSTRFVHLAEGGLAATVRPGTDFAVQGPWGSAKVRGTRFAVRVIPEGAEVSVHDGFVEARNTAGFATLGAGEAAVLASGRAPQRFAAAPEPGWARLLAPACILLDLHRPDAARPALLEFRLTNVSPGPLVLAGFDPDRPRFSLRIRAGDPVREGVVNVGRFLADASGIPREGEAVVLAPGRRFTLRFDVTPLLWMPGEYELTGVYQATGSGAASWVGQAVSQTLTVRAGR